MGALTGIRVADFTRVVAGPYATMLLGDLGAEIIKVEQPGTGDDTRAWGPPFVAGESAYFLAVNRNKKSLCLDLHTEAGRTAARDLIASSDIVIENFRPGTMDALGLGYDTLRVEHPRLIYCAISGYGQDGPYRDRAGYDVIISAQAGLMGITGTPDGPPVKVGVAMTDVATGLYAHAGILAALFHRERTGEGQRVDVSLLSAQLATLINAAGSYLAAGEVLTPHGSAHASIVPYQAFRAADGYVVVGAANDKLFGLLAAALGHLEWVSDERFARNEGRVRHRETLIGLIETALAADTVAGWVARLGETGVAVAPVNDMAQVFADPQVVHSGQVVTVEHPAVGPLRLVGSALAMSVTPPAVSAPPPLVGQHTDEVLRALRGEGMPDD